MPAHLQITKTFWMVICHRFQHSLSYKWTVTGSLHSFTLLKTQYFYITLWRFFCPSLRIEYDLRLEICFEICHSFRNRTMSRDMFSLTNRSFQSILRFYIWIKSNILFESFVILNIPELGLKRIIIFGTSINSFYIKLSLA